MLSSVLTVAAHPSDRELELLSLENLGVVDIEKVAVENCLNNASNNRDPVHLVVGLHCVSVDPVGDVQGTVDAERKEVVGRDGLSLTGALQHEELRQDGDGLEPDGKGPKDLGEGVLVGYQNGQNSGPRQQVVHTEGVDIGVVGRFVGVGHEVDDETLGADEEDLEREVVQTLRVEDVCDRVRNEAGWWSRLRWTNRCIWRDRQGGIESGI